MHRSCKYVAALPAQNQETALNLPILPSYFTAATLVPDPLLHKLHNAWKLPVMSSLSQS